MTDDANSSNKEAAKAVFLTKTAFEEIVFVVGFIVVTPLIMLVNTSE